MEQARDARVVAREFRERIRIALWKQCAAQELFMQGAAFRAFLKRNSDVPNVTMARVNC